MAPTVRKIIERLALPTIGLGLTSYGLGGEALLTVGKKMDEIEKWLEVNADYPSLVVAGIVIFVLSVGYQIVHYWVVDRKEAWRGRLIALRIEGVELRNEGRRLTKISYAAQWIQKADEWENRVFEEIKKIDPNGAEDFRLLDVVPDPRLKLKTQITEHEWEYEHHDFRLVKLWDLIRYYRQGG